MEGPTVVRIDPRRRSLGVAVAPDAPPPGRLARLAREAVLARFAALERGRLVLLEGGGRHAFGDEADPLQATVAIRHPWAFAALAFGGGAGIAEAYADGLWDADDLVAALRILLGAGSRSTPRAVTGSGSRP